MSASKGKPFDIKSVSHGKMRKVKKPPFRQKWSVPNLIRTKL